MKFTGKFFILVAIGIQNVNILSWANIWMLESTVIFNTKHRNLFLFSLRSMLTSTRTCVKKILQAINKTINNGFKKTLGSLIYYSHNFKCRVSNSYPSVTFMQTTANEFIAPDLY